MFEIEKNPEKVSIVATGDGYEHLPLQTNSIIYALNDLVYTEKYGIKPDILFIMDVLDEKPQVIAGITNLGDIIRRINELHVPLIAPYKYEEIPLSQAFPLEEYEKRFGAPYFSNTISYMIAYAMLQNAKEIDLYGVNQASSSEFFYEKAGVEYSLGLAVGQGIKVTIHGAKSELLSNKKRFGGNILYGYNQLYEEYLQSKEKFGEGVIKRLLAPTKPKSRIIRKINNA